MTSLGLSATILVEAGNQPASNTFSFDSSEMPSLVKFRFSGTLHHTSTTTGIGTPDTRYKLAAEDLAKKIAETLTKDFNEKYEKYGVLPDLPTTFYPPYRPLPPLPLLEGHDAQKVSDCRGLFYSNRSRWRLAMDGDPAEILAAMQKRMEAADWKTDFLAKAALPPRLDLHRDSTTVTVFEGTGAGLVTAPPGDGPAAARPKEVFWVQYSDAMTRKQRDEAIEKLLAGRPSLDMLMLFENHLWSLKPECALELLESQRPKIARAQLTLARLYHRLKRDAEARKALLSARAYARTVFGSDDMSSAFEDMAKTLGDETLATKRLGRKLLTEIGFQELKPGAKIPDQELALDEPACFFFTTQQTVLTILSLRVGRQISAEGLASEQLIRVESGQNTSSRSAGGMTSSADVEGENAQFEVTRVGEGRYRLTTKIAPIPRAVAPLPAQDPSQSSNSPAAETANMGAPASAPMLPPWRGPTTVGNCSAHFLSQLAKDDNVDLSQMR